MAEGGDRPVDRAIARLPRHWVQRCLEAGFDLLYPPRCAGCGQRGYDWCPACDQSLSRLRGRLCEYCGEPLGRRAVCPFCRVFPLTVPARSYARYEGVLVRAVLQLKYWPNRRLARVMGGWLAEICQREGWEPTLVVPVPLGKRRLHQRGYNQAGLVAAALAQRLNLPMREQALWRVRETRSQVGLDVPSRHANVQDAFRANPDLVRDQTVLLVDDLFTTGATLSACGQALILGGAREVLAVTVGRA